MRSTERDWRDEQCRMRAQACDAESKGSLDHEFQRTRTLEAREHG